MVDAVTLVEITVSGIGLGVLWALLGAGITLVFGLGEVLNLAQGAFAVVAAAVAFELVGAGVGLYPALLGGILFLAVLSLAIDRVILSSVYRSEGEERILVAIFVTVGILLVLEGLMLQQLPSNFSLPGGFESVEVAGVVLRGSSLMYIVVGGVVLAGLFLFLRYTYLGTAARTIASNEVGAGLSGINVRRMRSVIFVLSGVLAAIAGILQSIGTQISIGGAFNLTVFALIVSIVGGVRDIRGTVVAGVGLGLVFSYANYFIGSYFALIILFGAVMAAVVIRQEAVL